MLAQFSHERSQALLRQRNMFALTSAGLALALVITGGLAATRDREVVLLPTMLRVGFVALLGLGIVRLWSLRPATHRGPHSVGASPAGPTP